MKFHPGKCKVVSIKSNANKLFYLNALPMSHYSYQLGNCILDYEESEKDLGVIVNSKFSWIEHQSLIISKASQMLGLTKQTCHFLMNSTRNSTLYMSLVRSQFEHCSVIWRPDNITQLQKFETIQKNTIKWILNEEFLSYSDQEVYIRKCRQVKLLPIDKMFDLRDLVLFHKIINGYIPIYLPSYVVRFNGSSRLRDNHLDSECFICIIDNNIATSSRSPLFKNYFYRSVFMEQITPLHKKSFKYKQF